MFKQAIGAKIIPLKKSVDDCDTDDVVQNDGDIEAVQHDKNTKIKLPDIKQRYSKLSKKKSNSRRVADSMELARDEHPLSQITKFTGTPIESVAELTMSNVHDST